MNTLTAMPDIDANIAALMLRRGAAQIRSKEEFLTLYREMVNAVADIQLEAPAHEQESAPFVMKLVTNALFNNLEN